MSFTKQVVEGTNHLGEKTYTTYASWKAAVRKLADGETIRWDGDEDICNAFAGVMKPGRFLGEWDGAEGYTV